MTLAYRFPVAFARGQKDCATYYTEPGRGDPQPDNYPSNPYPVPERFQNFDTEWHAYNAGWNGAVPE